MAKAETDEAQTYIDGKWHDGSPAIFRADSNAVWLSSVVFDGARAFGGYVPDLEAHCRRVVASARVMGLEPDLGAAEIERLARQGIGRFDAGVELYICPMFYAEDGFIVPDPATTKFVLSIYRSPLPDATGFSACLSSFRRPAADQAPTEAKASCLYPNVARTVREARDKGFDTGVVLDPDGNVAEFGYTNLFMVTGGSVHTPAANGSFLNGITRQRVIKLLTGVGVDVTERTIAYGELAGADELFATGNYAKLQPCARLDGRDLQPGPVYARARALYFDFVKTQPV